MSRKDEILDLGTELIQTRGYSAFSYQDLSDRLGITKASIHYHFPTKEGLGAAVAKRYHEDVRMYLSQCSDTTADPWKQFAGYLTMVEEIITCQDRICAAGSVQAEYNVVPAAMRDEMAELIDFIISWIAHVITRGRDAGVMAFAGSPKDEATMIFSAVQGALQLGRAQGTGRFNAVMRQIRRTLKPDGK